MTDLHDTSANFSSAAVSDRHRGLRAAPEPSHTLRFFYFDAGGGHRSAANALRDVIRENFPGWQVELVNLFEDVLRPLDPLHRLSGTYGVEDVYNGILKRGWTYGFTTMLSVQNKLIKLRTPAIEALLEHYWRRGPAPDLVISLVPLFNSALFGSLHRVHPQVPAVTVMTDLADCPPHFWQMTKDDYVVCGSARAEHQAKAAGYKPDKIFRTSGMILKPHFYKPALASNRRAERRKQGLDPDLPTAIIMFGGNGARTAAGIVERLTQTSPHIQCIVMCGRDEKLRRNLTGKKHCLAVGFTDKVPYYMALADFFIGKPGPGSLSEALHMGLPVIVEYNRRTMPQERYNVVWIRQNEFGLAVKSFRRIAPAVRQLLTGNRLDKMRHNTRQLVNRAVFEVPDIFEEIMERNGGG